MTTFQKMMDRVIEAGAVAMVFLVLATAGATTTLVYQMDALGTAREREMARVDKLAQRVADLERGTK